VAPDHPVHAPLCFVLCLVFMLAKPVFSTSKQSAFADQFIVLDISRSMSLNLPGRVSPIDKARRSPRRLVGRSAGGNKSTVLFTGTATQSLGPLEEDPSRYAPAIDSVQAGLTATDLASSLPIIRSMAAPRPTRSSTSSTSPTITSSPGTTAESPPSSAASTAKST